MEREMEILAEQIERIERVAREFKLDSFPMRFELVPADVIYTIGAYGMPSRFSHWSFGKAFHRMKTEYDYNLSRIYELVINTDPCYAFLLEGNSLIQQKLVIAHVFAHSDFFKNNAFFRKTNRKMMDLMEIHSQRLQRMEQQFGSKEVEIFLDAAFALQEHIDFDSFFIKERGDGDIEKDKNDRSIEEYEDLWQLDGKKKADKGQFLKKIPPQPTKDLLEFLQIHARKLEDWQREILQMVREEMLYFWPQIMTKIMNEGWAALWHERILREMDLTEEESIEYAKVNAGVLHASPMQINPYLLGKEIFLDIEKRWGSEGLEKIFETRAMESDISLWRNYLTEELIDRLDLYLYQKVGHQWVIVEKDWEKVRDLLVEQRVNCGFPYIVVEDGDYNNGELLLKHYYEGRELDVPWLEKTLPHVYLIWGSSVHLETVINEKKVCFTYDGKRVFRRTL